MKSTKMQRIVLFILKNVSRYQAGTIWSRYTKKDRKHNGQKIKDKRTDSDVQNTTQKTKDRTTRTQITTNNDPQNTTQKTKNSATRTQ